MQIVLGADHAGVGLKDYLKTWLLEQGHEVEDVGCYSNEEVDYPDVAANVAHRVARAEWERGLLVCGTGIGMDIAANKIAGIRAARVTDPISARLSRGHNDANVLCLGAWLVAPRYAEEIVQVWLATPYEGSKHIERLNKIAHLEQPSEVRATGQDQAL